MIKYIASDLDGTLLQGGAQMPDPAIFDLILELKKKGILFVAASGRPYKNLRLLFETVKDDIAYVAENGSLCVYKDEVIAKGHIERELGLSIIDAGKKYEGCRPLLSCETDIFTDSTDEAYIKHVREVLHYDLKTVPDLLEIQDPFLKLAMCDFKGTDAIGEYFKKLFSSEIKIVTSGNIWIDFIAPDANKGSSLEALLKRLHISPEDGIAFGDQYNDVEMLELAGTSYAMSNAAPGIAYYADYVTASVPEVLEDVLSQLI